MWHNTGCPLKISGPTVASFLIAVARRFEGDVLAIPSAPSTPERETLRRARTIAIRGEAIIIDFVVRPSAADRWAACREMATFRSRVVKTLRGAAKSIGDTYRVDSVEFCEAGITVRLTGQETRATGGSLFAFGHETSGSALWVDAIDDAVEDARRELRAAIRNLPSKQPRKRSKRGAGSDDAIEIPLTDVTAGWRVGAGVEIVEAAPDPEAPDSALVSYRSTLKQREISLRARARFGLVVGMVISVASIVAGWLVDPLVLSGAAYGLMFMFLAYLVYQRSGLIAEEISEVDQRLDLAGLLDLNEQRANKLFQVSSLELKRYYDQGRRQRAWIFAFGIICILFGFAVVAAAFVVLYTDKNADLSEKIVTASLGAVGAILANFVAVIYLRMFSSTLRSIVDFHNRLVITHHVNFGNVLAARITDRALQDETLAGMAAALAHVGIDTAVAAPRSGDAAGDQKAAKGK
jgi:hypothetical protein